MTEWLQKVDPLTLKGQIRVPYTWSVGEVGSRFLVALRDDCKILGNKCDQCGTVYVPPRKNCGKCFTLIRQWVDVGTEGVVQSYTIVRYRSPLQPFPPPFAYVLIRLDGADVGFLHVVKDNIKSLKNGIRVRARFSEDRSGRIMDIECFEII